MNKDIVGVIVKIKFGSKSGVSSQSYLKNLRQDRTWNTPKNYLNDKGKKLLLYDPEKTGITAELQIKLTKETGEEQHYPWANQYLPQGVKVFRNPIPVAVIRKIPGFENFGMHRKDRSAYRNVTRTQYSALKNPCELEVLVEQQDVESKGGFSSKSASEARKKVLRSIVLRRGQSRFRQRLLSAYGGRCCVTGTSCEHVLEAAHIEPYAASGTNSLKNGLLLRSDIHVLFDLYMLSFDPVAKTIYCSPDIRNVSIYASLHRKKISFPSADVDTPDFRILMKHYKQTKARPK